MNCPKCNEPMENRGNVNNIIMTSYPPQWDEVYVCRKDKVKKTVRVHGSLPPDNKKPPVTIVFPGKPGQPTETYRIKPDEWESSGAEVDITINADGSTTDNKASGNA